MPFEVTAEHESAVIGLAMAVEVVNRGLDAVGRSGSAVQRNQPYQCLSGSIRSVLFSVYQNLTGGKINVSQVSRIQLVALHATNIRKNLINMFALHTNEIADGFVS